MTVTNREHGINHFCEQLCEDNEIRHLLAFVRNESGILAESYGSVNIKNVPLQYYIAYVLKRWGICLSILPGTIKYLRQCKAVC